LARTRYSSALLALCFISAFDAVGLAGATVTVSQKNRAFAPTRLEIERGTVVHINNDDNVTHHVYIDSPKMKFDSGEQHIGETVDLHFDQAGTFSVRCAIHPTMRLTVTVK
jgi:plastocyanin